MGYNLREAIEAASTDFEDAFAVEIHDKDKELSEITGEYIDGDTIVVSWPVQNAPISPNVWTEKFGIGTPRQEIYHGWYIATFEGRFWSWDGMTVGTSITREDMLRACELHPGRVKE